MSHTPGPWTLNVFDEHGGYDCMYAGIRVGPASLDGHTYGQRSCQTIPADARERMEADARLIAAAPRLLEVLRTIVEVGPQVGLKANCPMMRAARDAVAMVEGDNADRG
jgi:hypothetical protein